FRRRPRRREVERSVNQSSAFLTISELAELAGRTAGQIHAVWSEKDLAEGTGYAGKIPPKLAREYLSKNGVDYSFRVLAHMNLRGGVGKTTSTVSLAMRASQLGFHTSVLDLDPQGSSSLAFDKIPEDDDPIFYDIWQNASEMTRGSLKEIQESLFILPSSLDNSLLDSALVKPALQKNTVKNVCDELERIGFDLVVVDCPPSLTGAVVSTVCAADVIVIPVCSDTFSFKGLELTLNEVSSICSTFGIREPIVKVLYTKYDRREKISEDALLRLQRDYRDYLIPVVIRTSTEYSKALEKRETIFSTGRKGRAREDYDRYTRTILGLT
ncbi:MAG: ParA family protein, partial [Pseudomonadota bacterium]